MPFSTPSSYEHLVSSVTSRVDCLLSMQLWNLDRSRLNGWWAQFSTKEERFFAACLLDSLIYRSNEQFGAGINTVYRQAVRWAIANEVPGNSDLDLIRALREPNPGIVRLAPVICDHDSPTKSGPLVLRRVKKVLRIDDACMMWPWSLQKAIDQAYVQAIIFVDDFLGTGNQFCDFIDSMLNGSLDSTVNWIYAPIVAHAQGIQKVHKEFPQIKIAHAERLDAGHSFFTDDYWLGISNGHISAQDAIGFYEDLLQKHGLRKAFGNHWKGYGDLALCFGFEHATPDNTMPILWQTHAGWTNLLQR